MLPRSRCCAQAPRRTARRGELCRGARREAWLSRPAAASPRLSDDYLLDAVLLVAQQLGHAPSGPEYRRAVWQPHLGCLQTVYARFDGWYEVLEAAGFPRYSRYNQLASGRDDLPSGAMLRQRLGTWSQIAAALREGRGADTAADTASRALPEGTYAAA
jgi:hypothetical protein